MTKVKICGLRRPEDIQIVNRLSPDYIGFVFAPSRRQVLPEQAKKLRASLHPSICAVGVFVNSAPEDVAEIAIQCQLAAVQLHGGEDAVMIKRLRTLLPSGCEIWKAAHVRTVADIQAVEVCGADKLLLDAFSAKAAGGTGHQFDWTLLNEYRPHLSFFLAGGLNPENASKAVRLVKPFGVDVSSGVEVDGFKDEQKVRRFIRAVKNV